MEIMMDPNIEEQQNELSPEEAVAYRQQVIEEMEAEERGEYVAPSPEVSEEETAEEEDAVQTETETVDEEEEDPWSGVNPALKQQFDAMTAKVETLKETENRLKQAERRIGSITNELHAAKQAAEEVKNAPTKEQLAEAAKSDEQWETLKEDFPDWANAVDSRLSAFEKKFSDQKSGGVSKEEFESTIAAIREENKTATATAVETAILTYAHPDWEQTIESKEYKGWLSKQTPELQAKIKSPKAVDAIKVLDSYKEASKKSVEEIQKQRQKRLRTSVNTPGRRGIAPKSEDNMTDEEYRAQAAKEIFGEDK